VVGEGSDQPDGYAYAYVLTDEEAAKVKETPPDLASLVCSFCGRSREQVPRLFSGVASRWWWKAGERGLDTDAMRRQ
jgi:hypothetical protein